MQSLQAGSLLLEGAPGKLLNHFRIFFLYDVFVLLQVEDWKKGHKKNCKTLFIDRVDKAYDVGEVGLAHDGSRV